MSRKKEILLSMLTTGTIFLIYLVFRGLFPFGDETISWCDMNQQVVPLLCEFRDVLLGKESLLYSYKNAGGMNFLGVFCFFLASPVNLLVIFVKKSMMMRFVNILVLIKTVFAAGTASGYIARSFSHLCTSFNVFLSVGYAFCGYVLLYYQNLGWLDELILFPLLLLSLKKLGEKGSVIPMALCLAAMIAVQFQLGLMAVIYLVLACAAGLFVRRGEKNAGQKVVCLAAAALCAALISSPAWLPSYLSYIGSARTLGIAESLANGKFTSHFTTTGMIVFCSCVIVPSAVICIVLAAKKKLDSGGRWALTMFLLMFLPLVIEPVNKMWHGGSYQAFPGRYGYITAFLGICLAARLMQNRAASSETRKIRKWVLISASLAVNSLLAAFMAHRFFEDELTQYVKTLWGNGRFLAACAVFFVPASLAFGAAVAFYLYKALPQKALSCCLAVLTVTQSFFFLSVFVPARSDSPYVQVMELSGKIDDDGFYRVKNQQKDYDVNLTGAAGYNTLNHYTSFTDKSYLEGIRKLGYSGYWMEINSSGGTQITDALLNQKYIISRRKDAKEGENPYVIKKNERALPLGFVTDQNISAKTRLEFLPRPYVGQQLLSAISGKEENIVCEYLPRQTQNLSLIKDGDLYTLTRQGSGQSVLRYTLPAQSVPFVYYFDCGSSLENNLSEPYYNAFSIYINNRLVCGSYPSQNNNGILELASSGDEPIEVAIVLNKNVSVRSFGVFGVSLSELDKSLAKLNLADIKVEKTGIYGSATALKDGSYLFLPIPFDKGFSAWVNGSRTEVIKVLDTWMAIPLQRGENTVEMSYTPLGLRAALLLCSAGAVILGLSHMYFVKLKKRIRFLEKPFIFLLYILSAVVLAGVYLFPVAIWLFNR